MKKRIALLLVLVMTLALFTGCAAKDTTEPKTTTEPEAPEEPVAEPETPEEPVAEPVELIVFAAASMTETLNQIAEMYKEAAPNVTLVYNFDSSGTLKTQIEEGADCDVFISAAPKQMNALDASCDADGGNADGLDFVLQGTRINLLENKVALAVPEGNPKNITSYDELAAGLQAGTGLPRHGQCGCPRRPVHAEDLRVLCAERRRAGSLRRTDLRHERQGSHHAGERGRRRLRHHLRD